MIKKYLIGIEFEYLLIDKNEKIRYFDNLNINDLHAVIEKQKNINNPFLCQGDCGIKSGYWYIEGEERFSMRGVLTKQIIKGIEIRTPPYSSINDAIDGLLNIEKDLSICLAQCDLKLAIAAFNPVARKYKYQPPLNEWEILYREKNSGFNNADIALLTYGPDINISVPHISDKDIITAVQKLNYYAPEIVILTLNSPFYQEKRWKGLSKRTYNRANFRPACKGYINRGNALNISFIHAAKIAEEHGRIEFKAFDATPSLPLLKSCSSLILGLIMDTSLFYKKEVRNANDFQEISINPFANLKTKKIISNLLKSAQYALIENKLFQEAKEIDFLFYLLEERMIPAYDTIRLNKKNGKMIHLGGFCK
ncbi:glutamate-cysteine ligase family protein [Serratia symbiotica]|nr:glutamate-cysteine ligase family protein [Serratia symbiotica]BBI93035.1 glutamate--cysteine ligase [Serratia symbiotica]